MALGLPSLLGNAALSFLPSLLGGLFGDPQADLRKAIARLTSPQNVGGLTNQFYNQAVGSPAFSQAQGSIAAGANAAGGNLARELGARGIGTSGSAAVLSSLIPSLVGSQTAGLRSSAYNSAQQRAMDTIQQNIAALTQQAPVSQGRQLFAGGLDALGPLLQAYLSQFMQGNGLPNRSLAAASNQGYGYPGLDIRRQG